MFLAWTRGKTRAGPGMTVLAPRKMMKHTGQVAQVWFSCWILLSIVMRGVQAQGKKLNLCLLSEKKTRQMDLVNDDFVRSTLLHQLCGIVRAFFFFLYILKRSNNSSKKDSGGHQTPERLPFCVTKL